MKKYMQSYIKMLSINNLWGNVSQNHNEISSRTCYNVYHQKDKNLSFNMDVQKIDPLYSFHGSVNWYSHYGKQYRGCLKIIITIII
jgi:hypothetical protein